MTDDQRRNIYKKVDEWFNNHPYNESIYGSKVKWLNAGEKYEAQLYLEVATNEEDRRHYERIIAK